MIKINLMNKQTLTLQGVELFGGYEAPELEIVAVKAECGFEASDTSQTEDYEDGVFEW